MKKLLMVLLCLVPSFVITLYAQLPELKMVVEHDPSIGKLNPFNVKKDVNTTSATFDDYYGRGGIYFEFKDYAIDLPRFATSAYVTCGTAAISSTYVQLKSDFEAMDSKHGGMYFQKVYPNITGAGVTGSSVFMLGFLNDVHLETILSEISTTAVTSLNIRLGYAELLGNSQSPPSIPGADVSSVPNMTLRVFNQANPDFNRLGFNSTHYLTGVPIAWEVSNGGNPDVTLMALEGIGKASEPTDHIDLNDNFNAVQTYDDQYFNYFSGSYQHNLTQSHPAQVVYPALGVKNSVGTTGVSHNSNFIVTNSGIAKYLDVDGRNGIYTPPDVVNLSASVYATTNGRDEYGNILYDAQGNAVFWDPLVEAMNFGCVAVSSGTTPKDHSHLKTHSLLNREKTLYETKSLDEWEHYNPDSVLISTYRYAYHEENLEVFSFASFNESEVNNGDFTSYVKPLAIGLVRIDEDGSVYFPPSHFHPVGANKFASSVDDRKDAHLDLVVPYENEISVFYDNDNWNTDNEFQVDQGTVSFATGFASGVAMLVRGIYGAPHGFGQEFSYLNHRDIYDIMTFTAEKVEDVPYQISEPAGIEESWGGGRNLNSVDIFYFNSSFPIQTEYTVQHSDELRRSFAQRMGFGMIDAYRSVAHAITRKAPHRIEEKSDVNFLNTQNIDGTRYLHFGAYVGGFFGVLGEDKNFSVPYTVLSDPLVVLDQYPVLKYGGVDLPDEDGNPLDHQVHNNQGVTILSDGVVLDVPLITCAVIDGIVKTNGENEVAAFTCKSMVNGTNKPGKILLSGYSRNVNYQGWIKIDDLRLDAEGGEKVELRIQHLDPNFYSDFKFDSEIYGKVNLRPNTSIVVENGAVLRLKPGAKVDLSESDQIVVEDGGTIIAEYPCSVVGGGILVQAGGKLVVEAKPNNKRIHRTELLTDIVTEGNLAKELGTKDGLLLIEKGAFVSLSSFNIGGEMRVEEAAHVELCESRKKLPNSDRANYMITGSFNVEGVEGLPIKITGELQRLPTTRGHGEGFYSKWEKVLQPAFVEMYGHPLSSRNTVVGVLGGNLEVGKSSISLAYLESTEVFFYFQDAQVELFENSSFVADEDLNSDSRYPLVALVSDNNQPDDLAVDVYLSRNTFAKSGIDYVAKPIHRKKRFIGLLASNLQRVTSENTEFHGLYRGVEFTGIGAYVSNNNIYRDCDKAINVHQSGSLFQCGDEFKENVYCISTHNAMVARLANSEYYDSKYGVSATNTPEVSIKSGDFQDYAFGVHNGGSTIYLSNHQYGNSTSVIVAKEIQSGVTYFSPQHYNGAAYAKDLDIQRLDYSVASRGRVRMQCGLNSFKDQTEHRFHLFAHDNHLNYKVYVNRNEFVYDFAYQIRENSLISHVGDILYERGSDNTCQLISLVGPSPSLDLSYCNGSNHHFPQLDPSSGEFELVNESWFDTSTPLTAIVHGYNDAIGAVRSSNATVETDLLFLGQAIVAAKLLKDSLPEIQDSIVLIMEGKLNSTSASVVDFVRLKLADYYLESQNVTKASQYYSTLSTTASILELQTTASLQLSLIHSTEANATGATRMIKILSEFAKYDWFVDYYDVATTATSSSKLGHQVSPEDNTDAVDVLPVPFGSTMQVSLRSNEEGNIRLSLTNQDGRRVLENDLRSHQSGRNEFEIDTGNLARGVYFLVVEFPTGTILTKKVVKL